MEARPKIKLELTPIDKIFEVIGWVLVFAIWVLTISNYADLPDTIPIHYNGAGQPDGFGGKANILTLPLIATIIFIGLTMLNRFPQIFSYPINITEENAFVQYTNATRLLRYLKLAVIVIFGLIAFKTIENAKVQGEGLGVWFLPFCLGLIFIPLTYFLIKSFKISSKPKNP